MCAQVYALAQPVQKPVLAPAPGYCKNCKDYTIEEPLYAQPTQEPVAYVTGMSFGRFIVEPLNRAMVLPVGMALYSAPQENT